MLVEWRLDPVYIVNNWTDELLDLMTEKLVKRKKPTMEPKDPDGVTADELAMRSNGMIKVVRHVD